MNHEVSKPEAKWDGCFTYPQDVEDFIRAKRYLIDLFKIVAPQCEPMNTLAGLVSQIDNFIAGQRDKLAEAQKPVAEPEVIEGDGYKVLPAGMYWRRLDGAAVAEIVQHHGGRTTSGCRYIRIHEPHFPPRPQPIPPKPELVKVWWTQDKQEWGIIDGDDVLFVPGGSRFKKSMCWKVGAP